MSDQKLCVRCGGVVVPVNWESALAERDRQIAALQTENDRLTKAVGSGILNELLTPDESDAFVNFIKFLRQQAESRG